MRHPLFFIVIFQLVLLSAPAQFIDKPIGFASPGNATVGSGGAIGKSTLPVCLPNNVACVSPPYIFIGNGYWTIASNWLGNVVPPAILPAGKSITINPAAGGECILNVPQTINSGAQLNVLPGKRLRVTSFLTFLQ